MANIGQIIYNIEDYNNSGGYISTSKNGSSTISSADYSTWEDYSANTIDLFSGNVISQLYSNTIVFSKLGIQAPPGTKIVLNKDKNIIVGRTGVYELDEEINITDLYFIRPKKYVLDEVATEKNLTEGIAKLTAAEEARELGMEELNAKQDISDEQYWGEYKTIQDQYNADYQIAWGQYTTGINGVYKFEGEYETLYNIIIDYIYE